MFTSAWGFSRRLIIDTLQPFEFICDGDKVQKYSSSLTTQLGGSGMW